ncbi:MAG: aminoacetone oxidase family FAD-binding enzyme [Gemmatimonadetes bacterium]|nr:aminoacetone oxidase family FAD-binding enzyme [Gemmatimonadota bacterium]
MTIRILSSTHDTPPVAVVGAGAAGLLAALFAARAGAPVVLLERTADGGRKILISGGGRCNILPSRAEPERYVTDSSINTLRKILRTWPVAGQRAFFESELGMELDLDEETGKLFPASHRARDVRDALVARVREAGARIWLGARATGVTPLDTAGPEDGRRWRVTLDGAPALDAAAVVMATGGLSVPASGSDGSGLAIARELGHRIRETYAALTPLTADPHPHAVLAGVSLTVTIRAPGSRPPFSTTGGLVFTHRGWSGPAVLDASHLTTRPRPAGTRQELHVTWSRLGVDAWTRELSGGRGTVRGALAHHLPRRLSDHLVGEVSVSPDTRLAQLRRSDRTALMTVLTDYRLPWTGSEGYMKAEVTGGGVALEEVNPTTLESRRAPGLFLCGEMLDAFGPIGGHNFLWAWATGRAAGLGAAASLRG